MPTPTSLEARLIAAGPSARSLDLSGDPFFKRGPSIDATLIAKHLPALEELKLSRNDILNPEAIAGLKSLRMLELTDCAIANVAWISALSRLETLKLGENPLGLPAEVSNADGPLAALPFATLKGLEISGLGLRGLDFLAHAVVLEDLDVSKNSLAALTALKPLGTLRKLLLNGNLVDDLTPLAGFRRLRRLEFNDNAVGDLTPLEFVSSLSELAFRNNRVRSLKALRGLRDLTRVSCGGNPLFDDDYDSIPRSVRVD